VAAHIAQLALKHRVNKKQAQRIMAFVASPVEEDEGTLITLAKKLKKNNFAVDIINFGEQREDHIAKLQKFIETVKKGNNSMFVNIRPGESYHEQLFTALSNSAKGTIDYLNI
jgi:26S proteasome regulatory subunit N10